MTISLATNCFAPAIAPVSSVDHYAFEITDRFDDIVEKWRVLRAGGGCLPFQDENWLSNWYGELCRDGAIEPLLATLVDSRSGAVLLALPLVRRRQGALTFIEFADAGLTDYNAPILGAAGARVEPRAVMRALRAALPPADVLRFVKMPARVGRAENPLVHAPGARIGRLNGNILAVGDNWDTWHWGLERTFRKELERSWRVFERRGGVFRRVVDLEDARRVFAELKRRQRIRIDELGLAYTLDEEANRAFYDSLLEGGLATGEVVLTTLEANGEMVAGLLGVARGDHYAMVRLATGGDEWKNCSPGRLVIERTMRNMHAEGARVFDFTIGDYAYKRRLGVASNPLFELESALSWRGAPFVAFARLRSAARDSVVVRALAGWLRGRKASAA